MVDSFLLCLITAISMIEMKDTLHLEMTNYWVEVEIRAAIVIIYV